MKWILVLTLTCALLAASGVVAQADGADVSHEMGYHEDEYSSCYGYPFFNPVELRCYDFSYSGYLHEHSVRTPSGNWITHARDDYVRDTTLTVTAIEDGSLILQDSWTQEGYFKGQALWKKNDPHMQHVFHLDVVDYEHMTCTLDGFFQFVKGEMVFDRTVQECVMK